jgi:hypothetical protein
MKSLYVQGLILTLVFYVHGLSAQTIKDPFKSQYGVVSLYCTVPDNDQHHFTDMYFRLGWNGKTPNTIAVQFVNHGYETRKFKFAVKDVTSKKMIVLDMAHNSRFGTETLKAGSEGAIWSGSVDDIKDGLSLHIWTSAGDDLEKAPMSLAEHHCVD